MKSARAREREREREREKRSAAVTIGFVNRELNSPDQEIVQICTDMYLQWNRGNCGYWAILFGNVYKLLMLGYLRCFIRTSNHHLREFYQKLTAILSKVLDFEEYLTYKLYIIKNYNKL